VIANDGVNTAVAVSAPFSVQSHAPLVHIDSPNNGATFLVNTQVVLKGGAIDPEDGSLSDDRLTWRVNGQTFGSGKQTALRGLVPGAYDIELTASDSGNTTATAHITIVVVDNAPVASPDAYRSFQGAALVVGAPGVLGNDNAPEGRPLTAVLASNVTHGSLSLSPDGSLVYTPGASFTGTDSFTYRAYDGTAYSSPVFGEPGERSGVCSGARRFER
jgi:hypothetical protein